MRNGALNSPGAWSKGSAFRSPRFQPREAVAGKDIVLAATNLSFPVLDGSWIAGGASSRRSSAATGASAPELDNATFARAHLVAIGYLEQTRQDHAADIFHAIDAVRWIGREFVS
jgi:ornithine cyclodeaminase/alanine dehydrogenase-like protein (mu-crystallin family)